MSIFATAIILWIHLPAQKQVSKWYFGDHAGVDFITGTPVAIGDGQTSLYFGHNEGTSSISDQNGSLLFYTDGTVIWNRNHLPMLNGTGLLGNISSSQSSLIIPDPASPDRLYYVFTVGSGFCCNGSINDGLRYSKVDMCGDNANGMVVPNSKNILLVDTVAEKIAATRHANGKDYWILTHKFFSNQFVAMRVTTQGIAETVITAIGNIHGNTVAGMQGQLKISPNGKRIAIAATNSDPLLEVFDFDNSTGINERGFYPFCFGPI